MLPTVGLLLALAASCLAAQLPSPRFHFTQPGQLEIAFEDTPGVKYLSIQYGDDSKRMQRGPIHKAVDGRWYHHNAHVDVDERRPIKYEVTASVRGRVATFPGTVQPDSSLAVLPPERLRRAGRVVFRDDFNLADGSGPDTNNWVFECSMYGGYNWEIQSYMNDRKNAFIRGGKLYLKPTLTTDDSDKNEYYLKHGVMDMTAMGCPCTNADRYGCRREGQNGLLPPVKSAKLTTKGKHTIKFGRVTVRAKVPKGDWIWPAIWMLPESSVYGGWPRSGEIDIMESRGNTRATDGGGHNHGVTEVGATLHWGPDAGHNGWQKTHGSLSNANYWSSAFHDYVLDWTRDHITVSVDGRQMMNVPTPSHGFFSWGGFGGSNPWGSSHSAPFDQAFYLILNVAIGGTNGFFPDNWRYDTNKPWSNNSPHEPQDFWDRRNDWLPTWRGDDVAMQIESVEMMSYS